MGIYRTTGATYAVIKEAVFNGGGTFADTDVVSTTSDTALKPEVDTIQRKATSASFIGLPALAGKEHGSGTFGVELLPAGGSAPQDLVGSAALEVALGIKSAPGAGAGAIIGKVVTGTDIGFAAADSSISYSTTDFSYVVAGDKLDVTGSTSNDGSYVVASLDSGNSKILVKEALVDEASGGTVTVVDKSFPMIDDCTVSSNTGDAFLYKLNKACGSQDSLAIKMMLGCSAADSQSLLFKGLVPNSVKFDFPVADVATLSFDIGASSFETNSGETLLVAPSLTTDPYVGKNAAFKVGNTVYEAKGVEYTVTNTVSDRESLTGSGIDSKAVTKKEIKGSLTITFENWDELNKFKDNTNASIYVELESGASIFATYFPLVRYSSVDISDDSGIFANKIEFIAYENASGDAIYVAHK